MEALTAERLNDKIVKARAKIAALPAEEQEKFNSNLDVDFHEHFQYQQIQAEAHVMQLLTPEAAQIVYVALGEVGSEKNGGWAAGTDAATKAIVTLLMGELLKMKLGRKGVKV